MHFFGDAIEEMEHSYGKTGRGGPRNLLDLLPDTFSYGEAGQMRQRQGIRNGSLSKMIFNWKSRKYIEPVEEEEGSKYQETTLFRKTASYLKNHPQSSVNLK